MESATDPLPPQTTSFVGRTQELAEVVGMLGDDACRLLTLVGPGGSGKTRLALQAAGKLLDSKTFVDGVYFTPLQSATETDALIQAIGDTLPVSLSGQQEPEEQLLAYLRDKELLLALDNFEQLLGGDAVQFLVKILHATRAVTLLVTSREVLQLQEEWLYPVYGLPAPQQESVQTYDSYEAVQLFIERARQVQPNLTPQEEQQSIVRICRLVEGMPLAIELAASWRRTLPCRAIADEIERGVAFLKSNLRNLPPRHRSMRAVFEHTWRLLKPEERNVFKRLSIFRSGFRREAAEAVAGASLPILSTLAGKSLLRCSEDGRYHIHELLRQYAQEQLETHPQEVAEVQERHCAYYTAFLAARAAGVNGGRQRETIGEIEEEIDNIRAAWNWATTQGSVGKISAALDTLYLFFQFQGRYREGTDAFAKALHCLEQQAPTDERDALLADLLVCLGYFNIRLGWLDEGRRLLAQSLTLYERPEIEPPVTDFGSRDPLIPLGILAILQGDHARAVRLGERALQRSRERQDRGNLKFAFYLLSHAHLGQGDYEQARHYAQETFDLAQQMEDRWGLAYFHNLLGSVAQAQGNSGEARRHYQASYAIRHDFADPEGMALALTQLGAIALQQEDLEEAERLYRQSVQLYAEIGDRGGLATALNGLGQVSCALEKYSDARRRLHEALEIASDMQFVPLLLSILSTIADLLLNTGRDEQGQEVLRLVHGHPAGDRATNKRAQSILERHDLAPGEDRPARGQNAAESEDATRLDALVQQLLLDLAIPAPNRSTPGPQRSAPAKDQPLPDPLTERQLQVLALIAEGHTNKRIAEELVLAVGTIKWHTNQIYRKLDVGSRTQAIARARELKLIP
ncbi:MAG: tetratricopeptide repeat protein [Chloroflexota bacterium]